MTPYPASEFQADEYRLPARARRSAAARHPACIFAPMAATYTSSNPYTMLIKVAT
jgi:hypothetical protein